MFLQKCQLEWNPFLESVPMIYIPSQISAWWIQYLSFYSFVFILILIIIFGLIVKDGCLNTYM